MTLSRTALTNLALALGLATLLGLGVWLGPRLLPAGDVTLPVSDCNLNQGPCTVLLPGGGSLTLDISPRPIPTLKPLQLQVRLEGREASQVQVDFNGVHMDMGINRASLTSSAAGRYEGQGNLPICITGPMLWQATVLVTTPRGSLAAPFRFESGH